jgi:hypothetical protein
MKRSIALIPFVLLAGLAFAQQDSPAPDPAPGRNEQVVGPQLIAWSEMQKPQPVPQQPRPLPQQPRPLPPPDTQGDQSSQAPESKPDQQAEQQPEPETQQSASQSVSGTVSKVGGKYVLQTSDNLSYQLDDQEKAKAYDGKHVKVTGTLDRATGILHIKTIELMS